MATFGTTQDPNEKHLNPAHAESPLPWLGWGSSWARRCGSRGAGQAVRARLWRLAIPLIAIAPPSPRRRQSRKIFQVFIRAKACSTRALTSRCEALCSAFQAGRSATVRDDRAGGDVAAIADHVVIAAGVLGTGIGERDAVVAVARKRRAHGDHQWRIGVDDDLVVGRVPVVLARRGDRPVPGGHQGAVDDEDGAGREPLAQPQRHLRSQVVDDAVGGGLRDTEQGRELAQG